MYVRSEMKIIDYKYMTMNENECFQQNNLLIYVIKEGKYAGYIITKGE